MAEANRRLAVSLDVSAVPEQPAGAGRYILEIAGQLGRRPELDLTLIARKGDSSRWRCLGAGARVLDPVPTRRPARLAYERSLMGPWIRRLRQPSIEVHHGPHYTMPGRTGPVATVVTIHDLTFVDHPEWHERSKVPVFRQAIRRAARVADAIVCVSELTAERLRVLLAPRGEVFVAPHGVDTGRFGPTDIRPRGGGRDAELLSAAGFDLSRRYVLHLGTIEPRKGIVELVEAFAVLARHDGDLDLVLAGLPGWGSGEVERAISASGLGGRIRRLGWVPDELVPALVRSAAVVAYPSYEEGFGLPALETLACGARLVTTAGTAMSEVAGGSAWTAVPHEVASLAEALDRALRATPDEVAARRELGLERSAEYTWERAATVHVAAYRCALSRAGRRSGMKARGGSSIG